MVDSPALEATEAADIALLQQYAAYLKITDDTLTVRNIPGIDRHSPVCEQIKDALYRTFGVEDEDGLDYSGDATRSGGANYLYGFTFPVTDDLIHFTCNHGGFEKRLKEVSTYLADRGVNYPGSESRRTPTIPSGGN